MNIKNRIQNIKTLLGYTDEVMLRDDVATSFFSEFFNSDERFKHFNSESKIFPRIKLAKYILTCDDNNKVDNSPIEISYFYDDEEYASYYFDEQVVRDSWFFKRCFTTCQNLIKFEEIPDYIWEIIQNSIYKEAVKTIDNELKSARSSVKYWKKRKEEFNKQILNI